MRITAQNTDGAVLQELGSRLRESRLRRNLSQARLAEEAGVGRVTLQRLEEGASGASLPSLIRVLRALGLVEGLDQLIPEAAPSPIEELRRRGQRRQRAGTSRSPQPDESPQRPWEWGDAEPN
jgi:transcriptional regulator with XRE-family HTH domain